jgi:hypothetical protein
MGPIDQNIANQLGMLITVCNTAAPLNLSQGVSVNLSKVTRYEPIERTEMQNVGEGKSAKYEEVGTGEFEPGLVFEGGEVLILTPEQNEVFRDVWSMYGRMSTELFNLLNHIFPKAEASAIGTVAGEM